jgi:DNA-binding PadR family transcriptional regulator
MLSACNTVRMDDDVEEKDGGPIRNTADVALLGLLAEGPKHPWEISKEVAYREMRTWSDLSQSTIYKQLRSLEGRGHVEVREEPANGRMRRVYTITEAGRQAVADGVLTLLAVPETPRWAIDIATYNVDLADRDEAIAALESYAEHLRGRAECWASTEEFLRGLGCASHRWAITRRARHMIEGELRWVAEFMAELAGSDGGPRPSEDPESPGDSAQAISDGEAEQ